MSDTRPIPQSESTLHNVFNLGKVPYVKAQSHSWTLFQRLKLYVMTAYQVIWVAVASLPWIVIDIAHLVVPRTRKNVSGQTALVTGGGNGIGKAIALRLAQEGCNIAVADLDVKAAEQTVRECKQLHVEAYAYKCDVSMPEEIRRLHKAIQSDMGGSVDILVNNAGFMTLLSLREGTDEELDRITKLNLMSHIYTLRTFLPDMVKQRRGHIIGISSMCGIHPTPGCVLYCATKFGVLGLNESMRAELRQEGLGDCIHFTTVHPYFVTTRQDIMDAVDLLYPPVSPARVAEETVVAMLCNVSAISVPRFLFWLATVFRVLPERVQGYCRDYVLFENSVKRVEFGK